jgi:hypothetical protein
LLGEFKSGTVSGVVDSGTVKLSDGLDLGLSGLLGAVEESGAVILSGELELGLSELPGEVESEGAGLLGAVVFGLVVPSGEPVVGVLVVPLH